MGTRRRGILAAALTAGLVAMAASASAAPGLRLSLVRGPGHPMAGRAVTVVVRSTARAKVEVWIAQASVSRSFTTRSLSHGRYRAAVVFLQAGRWTFGARAGGKRVRLGSVRVQPHRVPLTFAWPTSVDVEPDGSLLVAENGNQSGNGRVDRVDPATGKTKEIAEADQAYSVAHAPSGTIYLSAGKLLLRLDAGHTTPVAQAAGDIGPIAVAANGDVYYSTGTAVYRLAGGAGTPAQVAGGLANPHGLAVLPDNGLLVSDTGNGRVLRIDLGTGKAETWGHLVDPRGIAIAPDGTSAYVVDASTHSVVRLRIDGKRLGSVKHVFYDPYSVAAAPGGSLYVVDTAAVGRVYRVAPDGTTTAVSRVG
jgi:sugar lactone lactonase YvrE